MTRFICPKTDKLSNYFIIENDPDSVKQINSVLDKFDDFHFIGSTADINIAMNTILEETPAIVFLSVDNVIDNPFRFVKNLSLYIDDIPLFIAISTTKGKAYKAIKNNFFDYLLKPLRELELRKSILKAEKDNAFKLKDKVCIKSYNDYKYLDTNEILFLKADNNTTDFHMKDGKVICAYKTLKTFENLLPNNFLRIHRSYIINSSYVSGINYGKLLCTIDKTASDIPFTKSYIDNVKNLNEKLSKSSHLSLN